MRRAIPALDRIEVQRIPMLARHLRLEERQAGAHFVGWCAHTHLWMLPAKSPAGTNF